MATATFNTPYDTKEPHNGQTVEVLGDLIVGDNYLVEIRFPDGTKAEVWPEEIGGPMPRDPEDYI